VTENAKTPKWSASKLSPSTQKPCFADVPQITELIQGALPNSGDFLSLFTLSRPGARLDQVTATRPAPARVPRRKFHKNSILELAAPFRGTSASPTNKWLVGRPAGKNARKASRPRCSHGTSQKDQRQCQACRAPRMHPALSSACPAPTSPRADVRISAKNGTGGIIAGARPVIQQGKRAHKANKSRTNSITRAECPKFKAGNPPYNRWPLGSERIRRLVVETRSALQSPPPGHRGPICAQKHRLPMETANTATNSAQDHVLKLPKRPDRTRLRSSNWEAGPACG